MKSDKLLSFSLMPSSVISTALSVAVSVAISATLLAPEGAFAASQDAAPAKTAKAKKITRKVAKAEPATASKKAGATRTVAGTALGHSGPSSVPDRHGSLLTARGHLEWFRDERGLYRC